MKQLKELLNSINTIRYPEPPVIDNVIYIDFKNKKRIK